MHTDNVVTLTVVTIIGLGHFCGSCSIAGFFCKG